MPSDPRPASPAQALLAFLGVSVVAGVLLALGVTPALALTGVTTSTGIGLFQDLPSDLSLADLDQKTSLYARSHGKDVRIASFYTEDREVVPWSAIPATVKHAALAAEDVRFYDHGAVDPTGIARAVVADALGKDVQGASTISQQYVKNVCVQEAERQRTQASVAAAYADCTDPSVGRKLREMRLAIGLEKRYSKDRILLGYLNITGFGGRVYGIESAARYYFDEPATSLTAAQAASLLAIVNDPSALRLDVPQNRAANTVRRDYILRTELKQGLLTQRQYDAAVKTVTKPKITQATSGCQAAKSAAFFCDYVVNTVLNSSVFGRTRADRDRVLQSSGWKIYTTLDLDLTKKATAAMRAAVPKTSDAFDVGGAATSLQVGTGRILSMVENRTFDPSGGTGGTSVNYNTDHAYGGSSGIQPGSTYKLFTLLQWLKEGHTLSESVDANARTIPATDFTQCGSPDTGDGPWAVGNDEGETGSRSVADATAQSVNGAFASMAEQLDLCDIKKTAEAFDVHPATGGDLKDNPASVIGSGSLVAPLTMATAYAGVANHGMTCTPVAIDRIVSPDGSPRPVPDSSCTRSVDESVADAAVSALHGVMTGGTASGDQTADGLFEFGKTGTTDNATNTWMIGSTSKVTTAVWVGNVAGFTNLRQVYSFPYCALKNSSQAAIARHCVWNDIQTAANAIYGGATDWTAPDPAYVSGPPAGIPTPAASPAAGMVPDVTGMSEEQAESTLVAAGYRWVIGTAVSSGKPAGTVASTTPAGGIAADPHTEVTITPSAGG